MGAAVAAIIIRQEKDLVAHFRQHGATSPETAKSANELGVHPDFAWTRLTARAIVREAAPGYYYLDELSWQASRRMRRRLALVLIAIVLAAAAVPVAIVASAR
jgi:hypothetical protein